MWVGCGFTGKILNSKLKFSFRLFGTAFSFASFGIGGLILTLAVFPVLRLLPGPSKTRQKRARGIIKYSFKLFIWEMQWLGLLRVKSPKNLQHLVKGGVVVVANHPSLIDVVLLISVLPEVNCVVKEALWHNPFMRGVLKQAGYIKNAQGTKVISDGVADLKTGTSLLLFPEGTRSSQAGIGKFQKGAVRMALAAKCNILPVKLSCVPKTLMRGQKWYNIPPTQVHLYMEVLEIINPSAMVQKEESEPVSAKRITEHLRRTFA